MKLSISIENILNDNIIENKRKNRGEIRYDTFNIMLY